MSAENAKVFHLENDRLGLLIVDTDILVFSGGGQEVAISIVINGVELLTWVILAISLMKASTRGGVPMLKEAICLGTYQDICSLHLGRLWPPPEGTDWHVVTMSKLIYKTAQRKGALGCLSIVNSDCSVSEAASEVLVSRIKAASEYF